MQLPSYMILISEDNEDISRTIIPVIAVPPACYNSLRLKKFENA